MKPKSKFIGSCDRIRQDHTGEKWWQSIMKKRKKISESEFLKNINPSDVLDPDEGWQQYIKEQQKQDKVEFFKSGNTYFYQTAGFEFFWKGRK